MVLMLSVREGGKKIQAGDLMRKNDKFVPLNRVRGILCQLKRNYNNCIDDV